MSNPIKYSTGTESLALKKGNFYIGTGDVGKGPTSSTGYYNGISPPEGGYTIYLNKETGGPSIYTASNDAQLISLTNSIAGTSYTTVNECLVYFAGQTDKMVLNRNYEGIVTDGLIFNLDAGFTPSYPKSGTTWYDVGGTNNGTLTNGPTFSADGGGGSIVFDGVDDYVICTKIITTIPFTISSWFNISIINRRESHLLTQDIGGNSGRLLFRVLDNNKIELFIGGERLLAISQIVTNTWYHVTCIRHSFGVGSIYINGVLDVSGNLNTNSIADTNTVISYFPRVSEFSFPGEIAITQIYNRALSADEVLQNYNAQKGRFGL